MAPKSIVTSRKDKPNGRKHALSPARLAAMARRKSATAVLHRKLARDTRTLLRLGYNLRTAARYLHSNHTTVKLALREFPTEID